MGMYLYEKYVIDITDISLVFINIWKYSQKSGPETALSGFKNYVLRISALR